ncbi:MAG: DUF721 domain-containing protein [Bacteroidales bacterium]|jgi:predicted nucleic acid-binding Zn ribbon protein|nr:DUF721 domain-containing protein [Bacteroidales bacterium]
MRRTNTESISTVLQRFMHEQKLEKKAVETELMASWQAVVGAGCADRTKHLSLRNGTLFVKMSSPVARNELLMNRENIRRQLNSVVNQELVKELVFT